MDNLTRSRKRQGYGALMLFLIVYVAALGLIFAPKSLLTGSGAEVAAEG
ncbi:MAG: hypothetical protein RL216_1723 [Pseudomonadota bacterium]|jgi:hypothetical protein